MTKNVLMIAFASLENLCNDCGPAKKAASATSAKPNAGILLLRHRMWALFTNIWTQYVQIKPTAKVHAKPKPKPA